MKLVLGDITKIEADAIVNAASSDLQPVPGICSAIFQAADTKKLMDACKKIGRCPTGRAVVTPSCGLPCKYIIHIAGVGWYSGRPNDRLHFADCYRRALQKAYVYHCKTVAVPLMFSGCFHLPRPTAIKVAGAVIQNFEASHPGIEISLVLYKKSIYDLAEKLLEENQN